MKATGIVRRIDDLGRIVLPKELRDTMEINTQDPMEIYVDEDSVILQKYKPSCIFCDSVEEVFEFKGKKICGQCKDNLLELKN